MALIQFEHLSLGYQSTVVLRDVTANVESGLFCALVGPNGAGKSTLIKGIMGELKPMQGQLSCHAHRIAYLSQQTGQKGMDRTFPLTVFDAVLTGAWQQAGAYKRIPKSLYETAFNAIERVGLKGFEKRCVEHLSGGQFQRVLFARMMVQNADLLLLDEPFVGVDEQTVNDLMQVLFSLNKQGATIILVVHDLDWVLNHVPHAMLISSELIAFGKTQDVLIDDHLKTAKKMGHEPMQPCCDEYFCNTQEELE